MNFAQKLLMNQMAQMKKEPIWGIAVDFKDEDNIFEWDVYLEGPPETVFEGGIFKLKLNFPKEYPYSPPTLYFISKFWHPNVYEDGKVCISILHPPGNDPTSGERPEERWNPTQSPETILLSVLSMLADPNISSPANVDASVQWRKDTEGYKKKIQGLIELAKKDLPEGFEMPKPKKKIELSFDMEEDNIDEVEFEPNEDIPPEEPDANQDTKEDVEIKEDSSDSERDEQEGMDKVKSNLKKPREKGHKKKINIQIEDTPLPTTTPTPQPKDTIENTPTPVPLTEETAKPESTKTVELYKEVPKEEKQAPPKEPEPVIEKLEVQKPPPKQKQQCCTIM